MNNQQLSTKLQQGAAQMGIVLSDAIVQQLINFTELLLKWNKTYNLTAITDPMQVLTHHLLDSLSVIPYVQGSTILDVGCGAGFPGIPLACYWPEKHFTLLDSNGKKTRFLIQAVAQLGLSNVTVMHARVENFRPKATFDVIMARAVASAVELVTSSQHLSRPGGHWLLMKGQFPTQELAALSHPARVETLVVPGLDAQRHMIIIEN